MGTYKWLEIYIKEESFVIHCQQLPYKSKKHFHIKL